jgi:hypothetical protein
MKKKRKYGRKKASVGNSLIPGIPVERIAGLSAGIIGGKMVNPLAKKYLSRFLQPDNPETPGTEGRMGRIGLAAGKIVLGGYLQTTNVSPMIKDAGLGFAGVGGLELVEELIPSINLGGIGLLEDAEYVGNVVEIDLDQLQGFDQSLESYQEVAGSITEDYVDDSMELAGMYEEVLVEY